MVKGDFDSLTPNGAEAAVSKVWVVAAILAVLTGLGAGCGRGGEREVVVYTALDREFSEPILRRFETETGIKVLAKYDTASTTTSGLGNAIRAEKDRPRGDVFWDHAIIDTLRLKEEGLLDAYPPQAARNFPAACRDPEGCWTGFALRARVLLVNTNWVPPAQLPTSIYDLAAYRWRARTAIAKPLSGTAATHAACLFAELGPDRADQFFRALKANEVRLESGDKLVALAVSSGRLAFGLTDSAAALAEVRAGKPVCIVYPDATGLGTLFIPNSVAIVRGAPHPEAARRLVEFLLSPAVEEALAKGPSAQIPVNPDVSVAGLPVQTPAQTKPMNVDFGKAAAKSEEAARYLQDHFLR